MKPAMFWTIKRDYSGHELMAVTSEKGGPRGRYYGRDSHGNATHCLHGETYGRFADEATAAAMINEVQRIKSSYRRRIQDAERAVRQLRQECEQEIEVAVRSAIAPAEAA